MSSFDLIFHTNGFTYRRFNKNGEIIREEFWAYQSIKSIEQVDVINNLDYWWKSSETDVYKCPKFTINFFDDDRILIYDEQHIIKHPMFKRITLKEINKKWWLLFTYLFNDRTVTDESCFDWARNTNGLESSVLKIQDIRNQLLDHFNNWRGDVNFRSKSCGII